jgi:SAM-dependent methyltransferase
MAKFINLLTKLPASTRPLGRGSALSKAEMASHWELGEKYFDGTRNQGYGGYRNDGRWDSVAQDLINFYGITEDSAILEIGCAKGFLLSSLKKLLPKADIWGVDISSYALSQAPENIKSNLVLANAKELPFEKKSFDLVISINSLHNILTINEVAEALREIIRVSRNDAYITVAAYDSDQEKKIIDEWAVVATAYLEDKEWIDLFRDLNYDGDYYWFKPHESFGKQK